MQEVTSSSLVFSTKEERLFQQSLFLLWMISRMQASGYLQQQKTRLACSEPLFFQNSSALVEYVAGIRSLLLGYSLRFWYPRELKSL